MNALAAMLDPGDEVILPAPCWVSYPEIIRMAGGVPVMVKGDEANGFLVDADALRALPIAFRMGEEGSRLLENQDMLVISPGVPQDAPLVRAAQEKGMPVLGELEMASRVFDHCRLSFHIQGQR